MTDCDTCGTPTEQSALWTLTVDPPRLPIEAGNVEYQSGRMVMCGNCVAAMVNRDLRQVR